MYIQLHNENYGYATATYGDYVAVGDPNFFSYDLSSPIDYKTGSVDVFRYNKQTDQHDLIKTLFLRNNWAYSLLARETGSDVTIRDPLHTETGSIQTADLTSDKDIAIDRKLYFTSLEDRLGVSLDMCGKFLVAGVPFYHFRFLTDNVDIESSGSCVDVYDFKLTEPHTGIDPFVYSLENPDIEVSNSFGIGVGINSEWIAVGSPYVSSSQGMVYMYQNISTGSNNYSWSLYQRIQSPTTCYGQLFGQSVKVNKQSGSWSASMVVGCGLTSSNEVYYFEFVSGSWTSTYTFKPTTDILPLTFGNYRPYEPTMSINNGYGWDVSLFDSTVVVGAYADRLVYEYTGSQQYQQGAVYIYEKCYGVYPTCFNLVLKTYGTPLILKNNHLGYSVDVFNHYTLAGSPKLGEMDPCFLQGSLGQLHYCDQDLEDTLQGQVLLLQKNTSSMQWEPINIYQKRKRFLVPHRQFGWDVSIDGRSMVVGAPIYYTGSQQINIDVTQSSGVTLDDITGKAYIYNLPNLHQEFHVGNVFYRNGKIVINTSGSNYESLFFNPVNAVTYEYNLTYDSQRTIYEKQIVCDVSPGEFNVSTNPTAVIKPSSPLDLNMNGVFDFQDVDVLLRYLKYKYTGMTDWSSSVLTYDDEISFYNYSFPQWTETDALWSSSFYRFENIDTTFIDMLDVDGDGKVNDSDITVIWKYFSNRLDDKVYLFYVNPSSQRKQVNEVIDYLNSLSMRNFPPQIKADFFGYDALSATDKTGSFLAPMATTIGLYNGLDLVAVAKLGSAIKLPKTLPINFVVKMDF